MSRRIRKLNYLARFLPRLSDVMRPIQQLTKKDVLWNWSTPQEEAFHEVKRLISAAPVLRYYDVNKELTIQCHNPVLELHCYDRGDLSLLRVELYQKLKRDMHK